MVFQTLVLPSEFRIYCISIFFIAENEHSKKGKKDKTDVPAEMKVLKKKKENLEKKKAKLEVKVNGLEATLRSMEDKLKLANEKIEDVSKEKKQLRLKYQMVTKEIGESGIFTKSMYTILQIDLCLLLPGCYSNFPVDRN